MKQDIYFNVHVSQYFNVAFYNYDEITRIATANVLLCPLVTWDRDTTDLLTSHDEEHLLLRGKGHGWWEVVVQEKPDTDKWNNSQE